MKLRLVSSVWALAFITTVYSGSLGQPLEALLPAIPVDMGAVPVAVWVAVMGLIGLDVIARRSSVGK